MGDRSMTKTTTAMTTATAKTWWKRPRTKGWMLGSVLAGGVAVLGLVGLGGSLPGCGGSSCDDGVIQASWDTSVCLAGDYVVVRVDDNTMQAQFDCVLGGGTTPGVAPGETHSVDLRLFDVDDNLVDSSPAISVFVGCGSAAPTPIYHFGQ